MFGLGLKGDPRAIDPLIERLDHPDPLVWYSAASAVASIAKHKLTSEQTRKEIFSRLCILLGHTDLSVRKSAAMALGYNRSEQAAQEVLRLLDDPHESVRSTAIFVMGFLRYKPALEAIKRLTRDRSKKVRKEARIVVAQLESEFP
ncbi:MAG: HEAT repeat domain-containing protein [Deltaproteobacteria bacterium]|nr:HEAT repeat domain-containing protein [Deltaproteobacteria bacterium]